MKKISDYLGRVHSVQSLGTVDGPGIRFVVFMQGCNLRCAYCQNPDTWDFNGGKATTPTEILKKIKRYTPYFGDSGGVTITGGEPLLQAEFILELIKLCKSENIHTAIDTSGIVYNDIAFEVVSHADLILLDIKMNDNELYQKYIGCGFDEVKKFLDMVEKNGTDTWIRQVILTDINDSIESAQKLCSIVSTYKCVKKIELLPFKKLCLEKYVDLGIPFLFENLPQTSNETIETLYKVVSKFYN